MVLALIVVAALGCSGVGAARVERHEELAEAVRRARNADLRADWTALVAARAEVEAMTADRALAAAAHYYVAYADWRLSSLAFISSGAVGQRPHIARAVRHLEQAVALQPDGAEAQALLAFMLGVQFGFDPSQGATLAPRIKAAWAAAEAHGQANPRVTLLRAISQTYAPKPYGDRDRGLALWKEAIEAFGRERVPRGTPTWGDVESIGWIGGAYLTFEEYAEAVRWLERAVAQRPDFWWVAKVALPMARRPVR